MPVTIDIDTGGTFTDGIFTRDGTAHGIKVLTTPHDLTVGMLECVDAGAAALELTPEAMLAETAIVRFSSTIVTNAVLERRGPAVGLLVSAGRKGDVAGLVAAGLVRPDLVAGVVEPVEVGPVGEAVELLLDAGARVLVVSLDGSEDDPSGERAVRRVVHDLFPPYFLGAVRVFLASDLSALPGTVERTNTAVLNAFVHDRLARSVYRAEEDLRRRGLRRPLMVVHGHAGLARVAKTLAVQTYNSGPVAGVRGAAAAAGTEKVAVTLDIGGTSADVSLADTEGITVSWTAQVAGVAAHLPAVPIDALAVGGGSIAWCDGTTLRLGPRSTGAHPGPACLDRGGTEATLTDANLVLGFLDPAGFHGGRLPLIPDRARTALAPLAAVVGDDASGLSRRIRALAEETVASGVAGLLARRGVQGSEAVLVAYGGGGPLHAAGIAERAGIGRVVVPAQAAVFSALGVSGLDVGHLYPRLVSGTVTGGSITRLLDTARRDMTAEGFSTGAGVGATLELVYPSGAVLWRHRWASLADATPADLTDVVDGLNNSRPAGARPLLVLTVTAPAPHPDVTATSEEGRFEAGERAVDWGSGPVPTATVPAGQLAAGGAVDGPALVVAADTTVAVPPGWTAGRRSDSALVLEVCS